MILINLQNRTPIYEQIVEKFQMLITTGVLEPDSKMPSVRALATELSINPNTIQKAYSILESQGYIYPVPGKGNFVSGNLNLMEKKQNEVFNELEKLVTKAKTFNVDKQTFIDRVSEFYDRKEDLQ